MSTLAVRTRHLENALQSALAVIGEESGIEELLSLLVDSVKTLAEEVDGQREKVEKAVATCEASATAARADYVAAPGRAGVEAV